MATNNRYLLDTNVLIYAINSKLELPESVYCISEVTKEEIFLYPDLSSEDRLLLEKVLTKLHVIPLNDVIKLNANKIRQKYNLTFSDCLICATAFAYDCTLVSNDQLLHQVSEIEIEPLYIAYD